MVATSEPTNYSLRNCSLVQIDVAKRHRIILAALIKIDLPLFRQSRAEIRHRLNILTWPTTLTHKRSGDQEDAAWRRLPRLLGENIDENGCADRMAYQNCSVIEPRKLFLKSYLPKRIFGIGFVRHARIPDFIIRPEFSLKTRNEFVVPIVMSTLSAALNK